MRVNVVRGSLTLALAMLSVASTSAAQAGRGGRAATPAPQPQPGSYYFQRLTVQPLVLEIALRRYSSDGKVAGHAGNSGTEDKVESYVWTMGSSCGLSSSSTEPSSVPGFGWHFTGTVVSRTADQVVARIEWRRLWENGQRVQGGASGSATHTLKNGERVELDRATPAGASSCGASDVKLEASIAPRAPLALTTTTPGRGGRGALTTTRNQPAKGTARGRGGAIAPVLTPDQGRLAMRSAGGGSYEAELWLVHKRPDGTETVQQQTVRFSSGFFYFNSGRTAGRGGVATAPAQNRGFPTESWTVGQGQLNYVFPPQQIATSRGTITVDVTGSVQLVVGDPPDPGRTSATGWSRLELRTTGAAAQNPPERLLLTIARRAHAGGKDYMDTTGSSAMVIDMPKPDDVLSFEFPPLQKATEDLLKGHTFSLRIRVRPVK
jgi:hypothetical protein